MNAKTDRFIRRCCKAGCGKPAVWMTIETLPEPLCQRCFDRLHESRGERAADLRAGAVSYSEWETLLCPHDSHPAHIGCEDMRAFLRYLERLAKGDPT